jgi:phosphoglycerate kinase
MPFDRATVRDLDPAGKAVLVRVDFNVPLDDGRVADDTRIRAALPTIELLVSKGARIILASHLGRPDGRPDPDLSLAPVAVRLAELLGRPVRFCPEVVGTRATEMASELGPGDVLLLENLRFEPGETSDDEGLSTELAALADLYVNDAFGAAHRSHASTAGVARHLPAVAGLLLEQEVSRLSAVAESPERPLVVVLGGAKVSDKIGLVSRFLEIADELLIGGAMCFPFFRSQGIETGNSLCEEEGVSLASDLLDLADRSDCELRLPVDLVAGREFSAETEVSTLDSNSVPDGWMGLDIGPATARGYAEAISGAATILWNGPMGAFELDPFSDGTRTVAEAVAGADGLTVVGGGDSVAALNRFGLEDSVDWVSTGGGASLELLEGRSLPGVEALGRA